MTKVGRGVYTTDNEQRIFVDPDVRRYEREDGGEVIVVEPLERDPDSSEDAE